ncbi:MAG: hypothetical protein JSS21_01815 [Proteobacteria bacterium]|nr:hypothetical protein [Pseudomonadota bacterium]
MPLLRTARRDARIARFAFALTALFALTACTALAANLAGWLPQRNLHWILFALPAWAGVSCGMITSVHKQRPANSRG